ncbi:hypothetical protein L0244_14525, partial [bacterium]|nr:hypothetical protein [bacterium]
KAIKTSEGWKTIISGQAVGSWHRQTLYDKFGWRISELQETISGRDTRSFYTQCQPIEFEEDDGRGYMAAVTIEEKEKARGGSKKSDEKKWKAQFTTKRTSPFMLSQFQSVAPNLRTADYGILARNLDELPEEVKGGLIFKSEIASAAYAGLFALNLSELGRFGVGLGRDLLPFDLKEIRELISKSELPYQSIIEKKKTNQPLAEDEPERYKLLTKLLKRCVNVERGTILYLDAEKRKHRAQDLIAAMADLEGGANMTRRLYNVAPGAALVAFMDGGNCLPPHIFRATVRDEDERGNKTYKFILDISRLWKVLKDNAPRFLQKPAFKNPIDEQSGEKFYNLYYGSLGSPTIENESEVIKFLDGKNVDYPLPTELLIKICNGPREAIREASKAIPLEWLQPIDGAKVIDNSIKYGEELLSLTT